MQFGSFINIFPVKWQVERFIASRNSDASMMLFSVEIKFPSPAHF